MSRYMGKRHRPFGEERDLPPNVERGCLFNKWCGGKHKSYLHAIELRIWTLPHSKYEKLLKPITEVSELLTIQNIKRNASDYRFGNGLLEKTLKQEQNKKERN